MNITELVGRALPRGGELPDEIWNNRHRGFLFLLWAHVFLLPVFALIRGYSIMHALIEGAVLVFPAVIASVARTRMVRALAATFGLFTASGILVHFSGGTIEAHFHFFVMVTLISLYEAWLPYLLAIAYVVVHHATVGIVDPASVYNHPAAIADPVTWAGIHGIFILGASIAGLVVWKRHEDLRSRLQTQLEEELRLNRALDSFSARVAHDLKNPLSVISNAVELMNRPEMTEDHKRQLHEAVQRQALKADELVAGLLQLARASGTPKPVPIQLPDLINETATDFESLRLEIERVPVEVEADPVAMKQALSNLFLNAVRYASDNSGKAVVTVSGDETDTGWQLRVADRGPGLDPEDATTIFQPFERGKAADKDGSGLGLAIVGAMAEAHGGSAWYEPREGGGAQFNIYLPRPEATAA